ncbi:IucA/IucC family C-terminal-domain containing protein [Marinactinospora thermotolerans]|uniref:Uncharacterized Fe-S protein n=1 Tax=Marinactinospora thermotolerans DSM 45154 TaxID=1122192 RepID=A0A1T4RW45_9ACTN|nr:IucA/IucC family C-terminal-domain containing protein [Marinactinospora thermotolerans]SKA20096.1 Uncharacterized Fe-S protein [Marinactinospora thermotolerans DSM 45154]
MHSCHPLAGVVRWINEHELYLQVGLLGAEEEAPAGPGWVRLDELPARVPDLLDLLTEVSCGGNRTSASAFLAADLGHQLVSFAAGTVYLTARAPLPSADRLWVRVHESGRLYQVALQRPDVAVLPGDPMARRPGVEVVEDEDALDLRFMSAIVAVLEPVVEAVRAHTRYGTRQQWGMIADAAYQALLTLSAEIGRDQREGWERAARMVGHLNAGTPRAITRQRPFPLRLAEKDTDRLFLVRGGCCFYYRYGDAKCATCPLEADDQRERVLRTQYEAPQHA